MWLSEPLPFIEDFIVQLDAGLQVHQPNRRLSRIQRGWLGFCLMGIILTNSICWARFERISLSGAENFCQSHYENTTTLENSI